MNLMDKIIDFVLIKIVALPCYYTRKSKKKYIRVLGLIGFSMWVLPAYIICAIPLIICIILSYALRAQEEA